MPGQSMAATGGRDRQELSAEQQLIRSVTSLPQLELRVRWVSEYLRRPPELSGPAVDAVCANALTGNPRAREVLVALALCLAGLSAGDRDGSMSYEELRRFAVEQALWDLERLLRAGPSLGSSEPPHSEPAIPDYGAGRELTLGERRSLARRPSRAQLDRLLHDPHPLVLQQLLTCPQITERDVLSLASRRPQRRAALEALFRSTRWLSRQRIRLALLLQPSCPISVSVPLVHLCLRGEIQAITRDPALPLVLRGVAHELLAKSPPWRGPKAPLQ